MATQKGAAPPLKTKLVLTIALLSPIGIVLAPSSVVLLAAMIPTIVARMVDTAPGRRLTYTVGAMNITGSLYFLDNLWTVGQSFDNVTSVLSDSFGWLLALSGAGAGWVIFGGMPMLVRQLSMARAAVRLRHIRRMQDHLVDEWGEVVRRAPSMYED